MFVFVHLFPDISIKSTKLLCDKTTILYLTLKYYSLSVLSEKLYYLSTWRDHRLEASENVSYQFGSSGLSSMSTLTAAASLSSVQSFLSASTTR